MMRLLVPLGLIALLGIVALIIIYLIKPNYQNKFISSTFVWKLSLKLKRKKLPTSRIRNILLIICQILILTLISLILAKPVIVTFAEPKQDEAIAILDSSASMRTKLDEETRYERAVEQIRDLSQTVFNQHGLFSIVIADGNPYFLVERMDETAGATIDEALDDLVEVDHLKCTYGSTDINKSISVCEEIMADNPNAKVYLYTDKNISYIPSNIHVVNVSDENEWNVAILDASVEYVDNYYDIIVDIACYGRSVQVGLDVNVTGANALDKNDYGMAIQYKPQDYQVYLEANQVTRVVYKGTGYNNIEEDEFTQFFDIEKKNFFNYKNISVAVDEDDSFQLDNNFQIYGGQKEVINIQYASPSPNTFVRSILFVLANEYADTYDIQFTEVKDGNYLLEGFDYYIFEHEMPLVLPTDGIVIMMDPNYGSTGSDVTVGGLVDYRGQKEMYLAAEVEDHPLLKNLKLDEVSVSVVTKLLEYDPEYTVLASCNNDPMLMYKKNGKSQIFLMNFSLHYSNLPIRLEFPYLFNNILTYFTPSIVDKNAYEIYEDIHLNSRGEEMKVSYGDNQEVTYSTFPAKFNATVAGTYQVTQTTYYGEELTEEIYVRIPRSESDIFENVDTIEEPYQVKVEAELYDDLLMYFAFTLVALLIFEWWLKGRDGN